MPWPPTLDALKLDLGTNYAVGESDPADEVLQTQLDAAVAYVERVRPEFEYHPEEHPGSELPEPPPDLALGAIRLAGRWNTRRRSPNGLVQLADMGQAAVSTYDPDIDRLLGIGRFTPARFA